MGNRYPTGGYSVRITSRLDGPDETTVISSTHIATTQGLFTIILMSVVDLTAEVNRAGDGRRVYDAVGDGIHHGTQGGHPGTPGTVARRVPAPRSQLHRLRRDDNCLAAGRLRLAGKASETLRSSSYLPSSSGWHG